MIQSEGTCYIPISQSTLAALLAPDQELSAGIQFLSTAELGSLLLLHSLPELDKVASHKSAALERMLALILATFKVRIEQTDKQTLLEEVSARLERSAIEQGLALLPNFAASLLEEHVVKQRAYLYPDGLWDHEFNARHHDLLTQRRVKTYLGAKPGWLTEEQTRVYREFESQTDEHLHIQGYAGTGKSSLIRYLLSQFAESSAQVLLLAQHRRQLDALGVDPQQERGVKLMTYVELAEMIMPLDLTSEGSRHMRRRDSIRATMSDAAIIQGLGVQATGRFSSEQIIRAVRSTVFNFCHGQDPVIHVGHIPGRLNVALDPSAKAIVCHFAQELWKALLAPPNRDFKPQVRGYHKIKWAALNEWMIPEHFTHVLVDECHDLPSPVFQILLRSTQARISLGDDYQNLSGRCMPQSSVVRQREMIHSVRSGDSLEKIINPIIAIHPSKAKKPFHGNHLNRLSIEYYDRATVPNTPAVILVSDFWGLFEWSQRLVGKGINPDLLSDRKDLNMFVQDCIEMRSNGGIARHAELFRYSSWESLVSAQHHNSAFQRIAQLLSKGYSQSHWRATYACLSTGGNKAYSLGLIEDVRNLEFGTIMLTADIFNQASKVFGSSADTSARMLASTDAGVAESSSARAARAALSAAVYVGVTRARERLIAPEQLRQWIEEISSHPSSGARFGRFDTAS